MKLSSPFWMENVLHMKFRETMSNRGIKDYIVFNYWKIIREKRICLLCSEQTPIMCHRWLIAEYFTDIFDDLTIIHL